MGFFHTFNYNIENWVWTQTLTAPCCMLGPCFIIGVHRPPRVTLHSRNAIVRT